MRRCETLFGGGREQEDRLFDIAHHAVAVLVHQPQVELRVGIAVARERLPDLEGLGEIAARGGDLRLRVKAVDAALRFLMSLIRGLQQPAERGPVVPGVSVVEMHDTQPEQAFDIARLGSLPIPFRRRVGIPGVKVDLKRPERQHRRGPPLVGGQPVPPTGRVEISFDASAAFVGQPQIVLRGRVTAVRGQQKPLDALAGIHRDPEPVRVENAQRILGNRVALFGQGPELLERGLVIPGACRRHPFLEIRSAQRRRQRHAQADRERERDNDPEWHRDASECGSMMLRSGSDISYGRDRRAQ